MLRVQKTLAVPPEFRSRDVASRSYLYRLLIAKGEHCVKSLNLRLAPDIAKENTYRKKDNCYFLRKEGSGTIFFLYFRLFLTVFLNFSK
jgi:hypothetical protein